MTVFSRRKLEFEVKGSLTLDEFDQVIELLTEYGQPVWRREGTSVKVWCVFEITEEFGEADVADVMNELGCYTGEHHGLPPREPRTVQETMNCIRALVEENAELLTNRFKEAVQAEQFLVDMLEPGAEAANS